MNRTTGKQPPRVGIDARSTIRNVGGSATYVNNLLRHLPFLDPLTGGRPSNNLLWNNTRVPLAQLFRRWDLYHAAAYTGPLISFCPTVVTAHDVSYLVSDDFYPYRTGRMRRGYYLASLRAADRIIVSSSFSGKEIARVRPELESKVRVVHLGVSADFKADDQGAARLRTELELPSRFLLHVGDLHTRRRPELLCRVSAKLGLPLVLVGERLKGCGELPGAARLLSRLSVEQLRALYTAATVLISVSEYEGFGLPLLEAMACGTPVVAANRSCFPEICGEAAVLVEPELDAVCAGVEAAIGRGDELRVRGNKRAAEFSWEKTAARTLEIYQEIVGVGK